ncbi:1-aminocyclopropane-1-carboxylate deaminase/D-cysteine desulfhydrase [Parafilimonas terrae]|uniref:1-aminocyclopropane-1-carboxylate deaminase n=1 Tax=Parafilimonas terrae TaxID=1465490 RepID=A0A1I5REE2_9BACT|nr:pyridoxal-phosphate dependent enzyme [Parafilimonas terrae]SFP56681.1 1-aminocyclopropane-1-carboxylate deaminase [Parafilimonas terrae]
MSLQEELNFNAVAVQPIKSETFSSSIIQVDVLRLDKLHPVVSGNKWFKLKYYLQQAMANKSKAVATFGGAFSNHIIAAAYTCNKLNIKCTGFIRGEEPRQYSQTLLDAAALNMQLKFLSREAYKNKQAVIDENPQMFFIPEGGFGTEGAKGAAEILQLVPNISEYNYIVCAVGTGTMLAGITNASLPHQQCIGISVMKNNWSLDETVISLLLDKTQQNRLNIFHDYHFGGYAKYSSGLIAFMKKVEAEHQLPLDFVYTAKALYAVCDLSGKKYFSEGAKVLFIHSGGLQGNRSLVG